MKRGSPRAHPAPYRPGYVTGTQATTSENVGLYPDISRPGLTLHLRRNDTSPWPHLGTQMEAITAVFEGALKD